MSAALPEFVEKLVLDGTKVGWYPDRIAAWRRGERIAPVTIDCAATRACNYACEFCALPGTWILLPDGSGQTIEHVELGASVMSVEGHECRVQATMSRPVEDEAIYVITADDCHLKVTGEHPIWTPHGYKSASQLRVDDVIGVAVGVESRRFLPITSIERELYTGEVYNLEVSGDNSYVANRICVHNCYAQLQASESEGKITRVFS